MVTAPACDRCKRRLRPREGYVMAGVRRCLRCTLLHPALLQRSLLTSLAVGTFLTAVNQGNVILHGSFPAELAWKVPLTYLAPFCVTTWGALINSRPARD